MGIVIVVLSFYNYAYSSAAKTESPGVKKGIFIVAFHADSRLVDDYSSDITRMTLCTEMFQQSTNQIIHPSICQQY